MERPSHTIIPSSHRHRLPLLVLAMSIQFGVFWLFTHGLATSIVHGFTDITVSDIKDPAKPKAEPPPPPKLVEKLDVAPVKPVVFDTAPATSERNTITTTPAGASGPATVTPPSVPDRPAVSIAATHTTPPYPVIARRMGAEGKVTLLLTVAPTGRVSAAQVTTSSGNDALDQAARQWVLAHWAYRPALDHGQPVASQATAVMAFNLKDAR